MAVAAEQPTLKGGALGLGAQLFQSIAHMAPAGGVIFSAQFMATQGGASLALAWLLATIACTLTALCLKEIVRKVRSAGGYFVIHSVAIGHFAGFSTSWLYFLYDPLIPAAGELLWGIVLSDFLAANLGLNVPWWIFAIIAAVILTYISYVGVQQSARITIVLGSIETIMMALLAIILIVQAGNHQPLISFSPASSPHAWGGVFFAMVYGILSFLGFESGVPLAEESYNARRSLVISIMASTVGIGLFYVLLGYSTVAGWGFADPQQFSDDFGGAKDPYFTLAAKAFGSGIGPVIMLLLVTNTLFAVSIAGQNAVTRVYYSLGRAGIFPRALAHVNRTTQTPDRAILTEGVIGLLCALVFGFAFNTPLDGFGLMGLLFTISLIIIYIMTNVSCFVLYWGKYRSEFNVFNHVVIPILATVVMLPPLVAALYPDIIFGFSNVYPISLGLPIEVIWFLIGLGFYLWLRATRPQALETMANEMARVELVGEEFDPQSRAVAGEVPPS